MLQLRVLGDAGADTRVGHGRGEGSEQGAVQRQPSSDAEYKLQAKDAARRKKLEKKSSTKKLPSNHVGS